MKKSLSKTKIILAIAAVALTGLAAAWLSQAYSQIPTYAQYRASFKLSSSFLYAQDGRLLNTTRLGFNKKNLVWTPFDQINPQLIATLIQKEDKRFYSHPGVDLIALANAVRSNLTDSSERGASTITMQLQKQLLHINSRSYAGKIKQIFSALLTELNWSKENILEAYLNTVYLHGEIQGLGTTSLVLFNKAPTFLTADEQMQILQLIRKPNSLLSQKLKNFETQSVHMADHYHLFSLAKPGFNPRSTIDYDLQKTAIESVQRHLQNLSERNVHDAAVLVLNNKTGEVLTYVGNSGPQFSQAPYVDLVQAPRQIGSTIKPFLYATAFEKNLMTLGSWIEDSPVDIIFENGTYTPKNHDQKFHGWVHPSQALGSSLNVPAVKTVQLVGIADFWNALKDSGFRLDHEPDFYGPSLALGTLDASLWDLTHAFSHFVDDQNKVFSQKTREKIMWALSQSQSRSLTFGQDSILSISQGFAVKTGTSKDMKDNWCVGFNRDYTVGVWVGNSDSSSMQNVLGVSGAAPIWRDVVNSLLETQGRTHTVLLRTETEKEFVEQESSSPNPHPLKISRIVTPGPQAIYAIDPAIPMKFQKIVLEADGPQENLVWKYKGSDLKSRMLTLERGWQKIELYRAGRKVDESTFLVK